MVHRFATYEEAMLFVAKKRSDGHAAEILNDNASTFWGPMPIGGVRVWVSEGAVEEGDELPESVESPFSLPAELSKTVMLLCLTTLGAIIALLVLSGPALIVALLILAAIAAGWLFLMVVFGIGLSQWVKAVRDPENKYHEIALALIAFIATALALMIFLGFAGNSVALGA